MKSRSVALQQKTLLSRLKLNWRPQPIAKPQLDPQFHHLGHLQRTAEAIRFTARNVEWWLSPSGTLREWLRFNMVAAAALGMPSLLVVPSVTYILEQFTTWAALLGQIGSNLIVFPITILIGIGVLSAIAILIRRSLRR